MPALRPGRQRIANPKPSAVRKRVYRERKYMEALDIVNEARAEILANVDVPEEEATGLKMNVVITGFSIDFKWRGPQSRYDDYECRANAAGFTMAAFIHLLEQDILKAMYADHERQEGGGK